MSFWESLSSGISQATNFITGFTGTVLNSTGVSAGLAGLSGYQGGITQPQQGNPMNDALLALFPMIFGGGGGFGGGGVPGGQGSFPPGTPPPPSPPKPPPIDWKKWSFIGLAVVAVVVIYKKLF